MPLLLYSLVYWLALQEGQILGASWEVNDALGRPFVPVNCPRAEFPTVSQAHDSKGSDQGQGEMKGTGQTAAMSFNLTSALGNWLGLGKVGCLLDLHCIVYKQPHAITERIE